MTVSSFYFYDAHPDKRNSAFCHQWFIIFVHSLTSHLPKVFHHEVKLFRHRHLRLGNNCFIDTVSLWPWQPSWLPWASSRSPWPSWAEGRQTWWLRCWATDCAAYLRVIIIIMMTIITMMVSNVNPGTLPNKNDVDLGTREYENTRTLGLGYENMRTYCWSRGKDCWTFFRSAPGKKRSKLGARIFLIPKIFVP